MDERFDALPFDAEQTEEGDLPAEWMLIPLAGLFGVIGWNIARGIWEPLDGEVFWMLGLAALWFWLYTRVKRAERGDPTRYVVIGPDGILVHLPGWYKTDVPYSRIKRIVEEPAYTLADQLRETFSWYGRVPERGRHAAIYCSGRVRALGPGPFGRFWRRNFRVKLVEQERFLERANGRLDEWRREHAVAADVRHPHPEHL
jgi:hypothetical protein